MIQSGATPLKLPHFDSANDNRPFDYGTEYIERSSAYAAGAYQRAGSFTVPTLADDLVAGRKFKRQLVTFSQLHLATLQTAVPQNTTQPIDAGRAYNAVRKLAPSYETLGRVLSTSA